MKSNSVKWDGRDDESSIYLIGKRLEFITVALETLILSQCLVGHVLMF